jgi:D-tyrosyl-tRNA(Tyr) deacylase
MRAVVQRVLRARVSVAGETVGEIGAGALVLLGVAIDDDEADADYLLEKILHLRVFDDANGKMNLSLIDTNGALLVVSQFTLYGDARRGRRPSFIEAAAPEKANELYELFVRKARKRVATVETGRFQAMMDVELNNSGPVTILLDSRKIF